MSQLPVIVRVQLDAASKERLDALCAKHGMSQIALMSKLADWFVGQNQVIQMGVLGLFSNDLLANFAGRILHDLQPPAPPTVDPQLGESV